MSLHGMTNGHIQSKLLDRILFRDFKHHERRLPTRAIAAEYHISDTALRPILQRFTADGLLTYVENVGFFLHRIEQEDLITLYKALEFDLYASIFRPRSPVTPELDSIVATADRLRALPMRSLRSAARLTCRLFILMSAPGGEELLIAYREKINNQLCYVRYREWEYLDTVKEELLTVVSNYVKMRENGSHAEAQSTAWSSVENYIERRRKYAPLLAHAVRH